jgi:hypothetical protein
MFSCYAFRLSSTGEYAHSCIVIIDIDGEVGGSIKTPKKKKKKKKKHTHTHLTNHFIFVLVLHTTRIIYTIRTRY